MALQLMNQRSNNQKMHISILSFGYKHGSPPEAELLIDVRFIPNPYHVPELRKLDGKDVRVRKFIKQWPETQKFFEKYFSLLGHLIPLYEKEGKSDLTLAVGCTGGRHRSVVVAEEIFTYLENMGKEISLRHRDIELE